MAFLNYNGRYCEQDFENAMIKMLTDAGWNYKFGDDIPRESVVPVVPFLGMVVRFSDIVIGRLFVF